MFGCTVDEQLMLRLLQHHQAEAHFALLDANRVHLGRFEPWIKDATLESQRQYIVHRGEQFARGLGMACGIWYRDVPGHPYELVGNINCEITPGNRSAEVGYWLGEAFTGRGIMTRSARALMAYLFAEMRVNRLMLVIVTENTASRAVAERLGFRLDGVLRHDMVLNGRCVDRAYYVLLADEWRRQHMTENTIISAREECS